MGDRLAAMDGNRLTSNALCEECCWAQQLQCIAALPNTDLDLCRSPTPSGRAPSDFATLPAPKSISGKRIFNGLAAISRQLGLVGFNRIPEDRRTLKQNW